MFYTVYKITNRVNGKIYIGVHKTKNIDDGYMGSGKVLRYAQQKYGIENFEKEVLAIFDNTKQMYEMESILVNDDFVRRNDTYNLKEGGNGGFEFINTNLTPQDRSERALKFGSGRHMRDKMIDPNFKKEKQTEMRRIRLESIQNGSNTNVFDGTEFFGKKHSEKTKKRIGKASSKHQKGEGNSQYGTIWIHTLKEKRSKKIKKEDLSEWESKGWIKGRKMKFF